MSSVKLAILGVLLSASFLRAQQPMQQRTGELAKRIADLEAAVKQLTKELQELRTQLKAPAPVAEQNRDIEEALRLLRKAHEQADKALELAIARSLLRGLESSSSDLKQRLELAVSDAEMWRERVAWGERMHKKGLISETKLKEDRERLKRAETQLAALKKEAAGEKKPK